MNAFPRKLALPILMGLGLLSAVEPVASAQTVASPAPEGRFVDHIYRDADGDHKYVVFEPVGYSPDRQWPVLFYLHGASGRGRDGRAQLVVGMGPAVKARAATLPFLVVFPQNENTRSRLLGGWTDGSQELDRALKILTEVEQKYSVNRQHEVLAGVSMGAFGAWAEAAQNPTRWKAVVAISGGGKPEFVPALTKVPIWAFHAADDTLVPPVESSGLVDAINQAGGRAYFSMVPRGGHNIGAPVLARDEVFEWMLHPEQVAQTRIDWSRRAATADLTDEVKFVPGADVSRAARIRINNDIIEALAYVLADQIPDSALNGWKPGRSETTQAGIMSFDVSVSGIQYTGQLEHAILTPLAGGQLRVQLAIRSMTMTLLSTQLSGRLINAQAGPMTAFIGYREPVWLTIDMQPRVENRQLKLALTGVGFNIPDHNWSISRPGVRVRGLPFLQDRIADRLVDGMAEKKWQIEQEIRNSVPGMIAQLEQRVGTFFERTVTYRQWPMPLWQPRFKFYPEAISVDASGLTLQLGALVAAIAPKSDQLPIIPVPAGEEVEPLAPTDGIDIAVSKRMLSTWTMLLASSDVARFHVLDLNAKQLQTLGKREFWNSVLPASHQLDETTELSTEFVLGQPFGIETRGEPAPATDPASGEPLASGLGIQLPQLQVQLAIRQQGERQWKDFATADVAFRQDLNLEIQRPSYSERKMSLKFLPIEHPQVTARFAPGVPEGTIDAEKIASQFEAGWNERFGGVERGSTLKDLKFATFASRWQEAGATPTHLVVRLRRPGIRIHNQTTAPLTYQVRDPVSPWGESLQLAPGEFHEFRPAAALTWRSMTPNGELQYTLPLGFEARARTDSQTGQLGLFDLRPAVPSETPEEELVPTAAR